jgi:GDP-L-fucose synthase
MEKYSKIFIAGHRGMVGSAIVRKLQSEGYHNLVCRTSKELDLRNQQAVADFFSKEKPQYVFMAAAKVGGIQANNTFRADFIYENLMIECNVIHQAYKNNVTKMLFLGSSCIYPKLADQPLKEEYLLNDYLEYTNEPYAIAKIAGIKLCENYRLQYGCNFISTMPTNLYGPNDNYDLNNSHVLPALLRKLVTAKKSNQPKVEIWGTGSPLREFLYVDDLADACMFLMKNYNEAQHVNVGSGQEISIKDLALLIKEIAGYKGEIYFNTEMPDGTPRKLLHSGLINKLGWQATTSLRKGIENVVKETADIF